MCLLYNIIYACGHVDVVKAPCEWRDEGMVNILGRRVPCENLAKNVADLGRLCMTCSRYLDGQGLIDLSTSDSKHEMDSYTARDQKAVMAIIVKNESHLRKRANISRAVSAAPISCRFPTPSEVSFQCCMNEEFLARRLKRRCFQDHLDHRGHYQDFLEASQAHFDAKAALNSSIFSVQTFADTVIVTETGQKAAAQIDRTQTASTCTQTQETEEFVTDSSSLSSSSSSESDESSMTTRLPISQDPILVPLGISPESHNSTGWDIGPQPSTPIGEPDAQRQQVRNASRLQVSWTHAELEASDSTSELQDEMVSPLSSPPTSPTLPFESVSLQFSTSAYSIAQNTPMSPCLSTLLTSLKSSDDKTIPYLSLNDHDLYDESTDVMVWVPSLEEFDSQETSDDSSSDSSTSCTIPKHGDSLSLALPDSECGQRQLLYIRQLLAMPTSKTPHEISRYIENHPTLMRAIRSGHVPVRQNPTSLKSKKSPRQNTFDPFDPLHTIQARRDHRRLFMQARFETALNMLDWGEIDEAPIPFMASLSLCNDPDLVDDTYCPGDEDEYEDEDENDEVVYEEKCGYLKYHIKHQVKRPSPLRRVITRREPQKRVLDTQVERDGEAVNIFRQGEQAINSFEPVIWVDVDLSLNHNVLER